jgi:ribosomal protein L11
MVVKNSYEGMIFLLYDKCSTVDGSRHNYLILGTNDNNEKLGVLQCMAITSMRSKEIGIEVPILLSNDMVSYIVPYNIHSFSNSEIELKNFKGCISDVDFISRYEFMQLLIDLYADNMDYGLVDHDDVMQRYNDYCKEFWKQHPDCTEFREVEQAIIDKRNKEDETQTISIPNPPVKSNHRKRKSYRKGSKKERLHESKKLNRTSKESAKRKQEKAEQREFNEMVKECVGLSAHDSINKDKKEVPSSIIPYREDTVLQSKIELSDLAVLNGAPRNSKDFSDNELKTFLLGYISFNYDELKTVITERWNSPNSFKNFFMSAKKEAIIRHLGIPMKDGLMNKNINIPPSDWSDSDIKSFVSITDNHKHDSDFILLFVGMNSIYDANHFIFTIKKEAQKRGIINL